MPKILHFGLGNFHRAHQAWYTSEANAQSGERWTITGVSLRSAKVRDELRAQNYRYTLAIKDALSAHLQEISVHDRILVGNEESHAILEMIADPDMHVITLSITEKAYYLDPETGALNLTAPEIAADLNREVPATIYGFLATGLKLRAEQHGQPINIICCDNLSENGNKLRNALRLFIGGAGIHLDLNDIAAFPNTMVDRIVPATTDEMRAEVRGQCSFEDRSPVFTERFSDWYIENSLKASAPAWGQVGAKIVDDVSPYELRKLRLLNGSHSLLAYMGLLAGHDYVHQAIADGQLRQMVLGLMEEATETLPEESRADAADYRDQLIARFENPHLHHRLEQIAMDGSLKLKERILPVTVDLSKRGVEPYYCRQALGSWADYVIRQLKSDSGISDPNESKFRQMAADAEDDQTLRSMLIQFVTIGQY